MFHIFLFQVESSKDVTRSKERPCTTEEGSLSQATGCTRRLNGHVYHLHIAKFKSLNVVLNNYFEKSMRAVMLGGAGVGRWAILLVGVVCTFRATFWAVPFFSVWLSRMSAKEERRWHLDCW